MCDRSRIPSLIHKLIYDNPENNVFIFFVLFSRFEYALKRNGFLIEKPGRAEPDWDKFAQNNEKKLESLKDSDAYKYFEKTPPRKQIVIKKEENKTLDWEATEKKDNLEWLLCMVRRVRNNLFHGGKYPLEPVEEPARNKDLIKHSITILEKCLEFDPRIKETFWNDDFDK